MELVCRNQRYQLKDAFFPEAGKKVTRAKGFYLEVGGHVTSCKVLIGAARYSDRAKQMAYNRVATKSQMRLTSRLDNL